jgi:hypothetical protein
MCCDALMTISPATAEGQDSPGNGRASHVIRFHGPFTKYKVHTLVSRTGYQLEFCLFGVRNSLS